MGKRMSEAVKISRFSFYYGEKVILHDIDLSVKEGEYVSIIGPNGAGKSTLKCLNRIIRAGTVPSNYSAKSGIQPERARRLMVMFPDP